MAGSEADNPPILRIGEYRIDPALDEISGAGVVRKLEPRGMSLLLCLARHAGQVVSVVRLLEEVWQDVVVNPDSVYQAVATLRRMLNDDARAPKYIANVVRRGYRLIAPVEPWVDTRTTAAASTDSAPTEGPCSETAASGGSASTFRSTAVTGSIPRIVSDKSVAVLPFVNISEDKSNEWFCYPQPCLASLFRNRWRHDVRATDLKARPRCS